MRTLISSIILLCAACVHAGDTYDCINAKGDYYAPAPRVVDSNAIIVAVDSARYEPRWHAMLDERDLRALTFIQARRQRTFIIQGQ